MGPLGLTSQGTGDDPGPGIVLHPANMNPAAHWQVGQVEGQGILPIQPRMLGQGALRDVPSRLGQDRSKAQRSRQATSCTAVSALVAKALCPYICSVLSQGNRLVGGAHPPGGRKCPSSPGH